jgi:ATP-dependent Zn protease
MALNALLTELDGFDRNSKERPIFVLAATNFKIKGTYEDSPEKATRSLDPALIRRFSRTILVDLPDSHDRKKYLQKSLIEQRKCVISESVIELLAEKSVGMSIAQIESFIETATRQAFKNNGTLNEDLLLEALDTSSEGEMKHWSPEFLESTARHEAGHAVMYWLSGWWSPEVSIIARADHGGGMRRSETDIKRESLTRDEILANIRTALGGRAAEILYYGEKGLTTGASGDLEHVTNLARQMICRYGMEKDFGLMAVPEFFNHPEAISSPLYQKANDIVTKILNTEMENTLRLLKENKKYLDALASALLQKNRIYRKELQEILPAIPGDVPTKSASSISPKVKVKL